MFSVKQDLMVGPLLTVLIDSGACSNNYITEKAVDVFKQQSRIINYKDTYYIDDGCECKSVKICSSFNNCIINNKFGEFK